LISDGEKPCVLEFFTAEAVTEGHPDKLCDLIADSVLDMARYIAKNMVAAGLADCCQVSLAYAIGVAQPVMVQVDTFGTGKVCEDDCLASLLFSS
jgi:S-adenosylmethionine synthetase